MPARRTTIVEIAQKLNVSAMTVSRALTGSAGISEKTRQKVLQCAEALEYRPNRWARSLVTRKSSIIGVVIPDIAHSYFAEITRGIEEIVGEAGFSVLLCHSSMDPERERSEIQTLIDSRVEGLIVASEQPENSPETFVGLQAMSVPFVLVDRFFVGRRLPCVRVDDLETGRLATAHLIELGHRRVAHIRGPALSPASLRYRGYLNALKRHSIAVDQELITRGAFDMDTGRSAMNELLARAERPTAVFAANDPMAIGAIYACREAGLAVPDDMAIIGAGNIEGAYHPNPFLTTIDWPRVELGRIAANHLLKAISSPKTNPAILEKLKPRLLKRQSTAPPGYRGIANRNTA